jgi:hypothetical protein
MKSTMMAVPLSTNTMFAGEMDDAMRPREAAKREALGENIRLDEKLWAVASVEQENRRVKDGWEDILANIPERVPLSFKEDDEGDYEIIHLSPNQEKIKSADILTYVLRIPVERHSSAYAMRVARIMKRHGWQRTSNGKVDWDCRFRLRIPVGNFGFASL